MITDDSRGDPVRRFVLTAKLVAATELLPTPGQAMTSKINHASKFLFELKCRRRGDEGRGRPRSIVISPPLEARLVGEPTERERPDGVLEWSSQLEVDAPASSEPGSRRSILSLEWDDSTLSERMIDWEVEPSLTVAPSGVVLTTADRTMRSFLVTSIDRAFSIKRVTGPMEPRADSSNLAESAMKHELALQPSSEPWSPGAHDLVIETDHPDQPKLVVSILVLSDR